MEELTLKQKILKFIEFEVNDTNTFQTTEVVVDMKDAEYDEYGELIWIPEVDPSMPVIGNVGTKRYSATKERLIEIFNTFDDELIGTFDKGLYTVQIKAWEIL